MIIKSLCCRALGAAILAAPLGSILADSPVTAPQFTHLQPADWINSGPLSVTELRGKVVLVEFWAFDCINCLRSAEWVRTVAYQQAAAGLVVVAVHTPELPQEKIPTNVLNAVRRLDIKYPVMLDGDYSYWKAMNNRYWPAFYVIGPDGRVRAQAIGEMHSGEANALALESTIKQLLATRN